MQIKHISDFCLVKTRVHKDTEGTMRQQDVMQYNSVTGNHCLILHDFHRKKRGRSVLLRNDALGGKSDGAYGGAV